MAFLRFANAKVVHPQVSKTQWQNVRTAAKKVPTEDGGIAPSLVQRASEFLGAEFSPKRYLLTHATIIASVDVSSPPGVKTGSIMEDGFRVNRRYSDFRVTTETDKFINNNYDAWSRGVLMKAFQTFIGGHNFVEHVQIEDLSKGRIIDAVARDIGDSIYVDILIATDRKHKDLVKAIESGKMGTLSMGCFPPGTHITMADGCRIAIEDVAPGDMVMTHKGRAREVLNKQTRIDTWDMRTIHAVGLASPITSTGNHPYYVMRPADVCACGCGESLPSYKPRQSGTDTTRRLKRRFRVGHDKRILNPNNTYSMDEFKRRKALMDEIQKPELVKVRADELRVGDFVAFPRVQDGEHTIPTTKGKARLLGYFLAEGSFLKTKGLRTATQFCFSLTEKDTFVSEVAHLLTQEFDLANEPWVHDRDDRNTCTVTVQDADVADWFFQKGGEYSHGKRLSVDAMNWSVENHKHLIGTWLNGDGCRAKAHGGFLSGTTVSLNLASQMHSLMVKCGWFARFEARVGAASVTVAEAVNGGVAVRDEVTGRLPAYLLTVGNTQSVELQGYCAKAPTTARWSNQNNRTFNDWVVAPIKAIEKSTYEGAVHNMEVAEDHTYIAGGASVGNCTVDGTICTKCGHWAADETEMCPHIKYEKGNLFFDEQGQKNRVAELCGHESIDPTGGVTFIEASWVETPAFTGAVMRNVLEPSAQMSQQIQKVLASTPPEWLESATAKAASGDGVITRNFQTPTHNRIWAHPATLEAGDVFLAGWLEDDGGSEEPEGEPAETAPEEEPTETAPEEVTPASPASPLKDVEDEVYKDMLDKLKRRLKDDMQQPSTELPHTPTESTNENLNPQAAVRAYQAGLQVICRTASSDVALVDGVAQFNQQLGVDVPVLLYRVALKVGDPAEHGSSQAYRKACRTVMQRKPTSRESLVLARLGQLLFRRGSLEGGYDGKRHGGDGS